MSVDPLDGWIAELERQRKHAAAFGVAMLWAIVGLVAVLSCLATIANAQEIVPGQPPTVVYHATQAQRTCTFEAVTLAMGRPLAVLPGQTTDLLVYWSPDARNWLIVAHQTDTDRTCVLARGSDARVSLPVVPQGAPS